MNISLAQKVLETLNAHPEKHNQSTWITPSCERQHPNGDPLNDNACGTAGCVAGWAVQLAGNQIVTNVPYIHEADGYTYYHTEISGKKVSDFFREDFEEHYEEYAELINAEYGDHIDYR